jgi:hypothetical protein
MKRSKLFGLLLALLGVTLLHCQFDCLDNSWHLAKKNDDKSYHGVSCTCPCDAYRAKGLYTEQRNRCLQCLHFHDPRPLSVSFKGSSASELTLSPKLLSRLIIEAKKRLNS